VLFFWTETADSGDPWSAVLAAAAERERDETAEDDDATT
jgi:hypothetical protein